MQKRNIFHRIRDMGNLFTEFGIGFQAPKFVWYTFLYNGKTENRKKFRLRSIHFNEVEVRLGTSDLIVLYETFGAKYDTPPASLSPSATSRIWDLGSNIGLTVAIYATAFPNARVTGVELDPETADLASKNVSAFGSRCNILTGAVWVEDGTIQYNINRGREYGAHVTGPSTSQSQRRATSWSLNTLLKNDTFVDFIKMDIEGAEATILKENTEWASKVGCIKVECHAPYSSEEAQKDLEKLGFNVTRNQLHWSSILGFKQ